MNDDIPRRARIELMTFGERLIYDAILNVEEMSADTRLTDCVVLLQQARDKLADYVDSQLPTQEKPR